MDPLLLQYTRRLPDNSVVVFLLGLATLCCIVICNFMNRTRRIQQFPTLSFSIPLLSYIGTIRYFRDPQKFVEDGFRKWSGKPFRIPMPMEWWILITEQTLVDEVQKAPENILSALLPLREEVQARYTLGAHVADNPYHFGVIQTQITRDLPKLVPELYNEMVDALHWLIPPTEDWTSVRALDTIKTIVATISGRILVGLPLNRNPEWIKLNRNFTDDVMKTAFILRLFPHFLRPYIYLLTSKLPKHQRDGLKYLSPVIASRRRDKERNAQVYEKPADFLHWLMDKAKGDEEQDHFLVSRVFSVYFAAMQSTSMALTHALFYIALLPEYWAPLREEVEAVIKCDGWTKAAIDKMYKVDSFIKESQRLHPLATCLLTRRAVTDYTFSDGTKIPANSTISVSLTHTHRNPDTYEDPTTFDGFRFIKMKERAEADGLEDKKFDMVTTDLQFLAFSHGKHVCPGRFLASVEIKMIVAYIITTYDLKLANGIRPSDQFLFHVCIPNPTAEILFRKRKA